MTYDVVMLDPPWFHYGDPSKPAAAGKHYACIPDDEMLRLDVLSYMHPRRSLAFVWATKSLQRSPLASPACTRHPRGASCSPASSDRGGPASATSCRSRRASGSAGGYASTMRNLNRHHAARWAARRRHVLACVRATSHRVEVPGRLRKLEAGCGGRCYLCAPHKFRKHPRPRVEPDAD